MLRQPHFAMISIKIHERALNSGLSYPRRTKQSTINDQRSNGGKSHSFMEGKEDKKEWRAWRESWRNSKQKPNGEAGLAEQMVPAFFARGAPYSQKSLQGERERDGERWWVATLTTHLHFLSSSASEERESWRSFDRHHQYCATFGSLSVQSRWHAASIIPVLCFTDTLSFTFCWTYWLFSFFPSKQMHCRNFSTHAYFLKCTSAFAFGADWKRSCSWASACGPVWQPISSVSLRLKVHCGQTHTNTHSTAWLNEWWMMDECEAW